MRTFTALINKIHCRRSILYGVVHAWFRILKNDWRLSDTQIVGYKQYNIQKLVTIGYMLIMLNCICLVVLPYFVWDNKMLFFNKKLGHCQNNITGVIFNLSYKKHTFHCSVRSRFQGKYCNFSETKTAPKNFLSSKTICQIVLKTTSMKSSASLNTFYLSIILKLSRQCLW